MGGFGIALPRVGTVVLVADSARDRADADDLAAERNEQVAQGHEWAAEARPESRGNLHSDAAIKFRRAAGEDRSGADVARNEAGEEKH